MYFNLSFIYKCDIYIFFNQLDSIELLFFHWRIPYININKRRSNISNHGEWLVVVAVWYQTSLKNSPFLVVDFFLFLYFTSFSCCHLLATQCFGYNIPILILFVFRRRLVLYCLLIENQYPTFLRIFYLYGIYTFSSYKSSRIIISLVIWNVKIGTETLCIKHTHFAFQIKRKLSFNLINFFSVFLWHSVFSTAFINLRKNELFTILFHFLWFFLHFFIVFFLTLWCLGSRVVSIRTRPSTTRIIH